jgi:hypothetical protein
VVAVDDPHGVLDAVAAWVRNPLPAGHELVLDPVAEAVAHAAVAPAEADAALDSRQQPRELVVLDRADRPDRDDQVERGELSRSRTVRCDR